jgi:hypothetical protein
MATDTATTTTAARRQAGKKEWERGEMGIRDPTMDGVKLESANFKF